MPGLSTFARIWLLSNVLLISACMPADGPYSDAIKAGRGFGEDPIPYALVKLTPKVVESLAQYTPRIANQFTIATARGYPFGDGRCRERYGFRGVLRGSFHTRGS